MDKLSPSPCGANSPLEEWTAGRRVSLARVPSGGVGAAGGRACGDPGTGGPELVGQGGEAGGGRESESLGEQAHESWHEA